MLPEYFVYFPAIASLIGGYGYLKDTLSGKTKPNRVTWLLWAVVPMIAFVAELQKGVGLPALMTFMVGFIPILILAASLLNKRAEWKLGAFDFACGAFSVIGIILWLTTKEADHAIIFSILADFLAGLPTWKKAFFYPDTESSSAYLGGIAAAIITILTLNNYNLAHFGFPIYILFMNSVLVFFIVFRPGTSIKK